MNTTEMFSSSRLIMGAALVTMFAVPAAAFADTLNRQLELGMSGSDVSSLQTFLGKDATIYPQGLVTGYFGSLTKSAVSNFQVRNNISSVGRVGPVTLAALNSQMAGSVGVDVDAPIFSGLNVTVSNTYASVKWNTNEMAKGIVYYGTSPLSEYEYQHSVTISGMTAMTDTALRTSQNVTLSGLQANTLYYYDVYVTDASGNVSMTMQSTFRTLN